MAPGDLTTFSPFCKEHKVRLMSEKIKHSIWKRLGSLRRSSSFAKRASDSHSSGSSDPRLGTYPPLNVCARRGSQPTLKLPHRGTKMPFTHTRHASLIQHEPFPPVPRKVNSVPSMPDASAVQVSQKSSSNTSASQKKSAVCPDADSRRCSKCGLSSSTSASHSANTAVKPSDRRSQHKFHKLFNLDQTQPLIKSFPCALVGDILFQGTFYASEHFFCFHSKFAKKRKLIQVAIREVTNLTREKTAGIIPNAIAVHTKHSRFMFASIIGRENIFRMLNNLWETQLSMNNTMNWDVSTSGNAGPEVATGALTPAASPRTPTKAWLSASQAGGPQVTNDGVIHDSSVDTELDTEEEEDDEEPVTVCLNGERRAAVADPSARSSVNPLVSPPARPSADSSLCRRKPDDRLGLTPNHSTPGVPSLGKCLRDVWAVPRVQLCLCIAYIILIFLAFSAIVLAWRVHTYQVFLHDRMERLDSAQSVYEPFCHANDAQCNLYRLRQQTHSSRIRHVQSVMNSNIRTLNDLARRLRVPEPGQTPIGSGPAPEKSEQHSEAVPAS